LERSENLTLKMQGILQTSKRVSSNHPPPKPHPTSSIVEARNSNAENEPSLYSKYSPTLQKSNSMSGGYFGVAIS
jgi:hypothetical protein